MSATGASGAKGQVGRLLTLVPYLYSQEDDVRLDKAAADLGVEEKQLVKDLQVDRKSVV